ncbi:MAG: hypothetical protein MHM6MM_008547 [Cercozoa sp. M6MM]
MIQRELPRDLWPRDLSSVLHWCDRIDLDADGEHVASDTVTDWSVTRCARAWVDLARVDPARFLETCAGVLETRHALSPSQVAALTLQHSSRLLQRLSKPSQRRIRQSMKALSAKPLRVAATGKDAVTMRNAMLLGLSLRELGDLDVYQPEGRLYLPE